VRTRSQKHIDTSYILSYEIPPIISTAARRNNSEIKS